MLRLLYYLLAMCTFCLMFKLKCFAGYRLIWASCSCCYFNLLADYDFSIMQLFYLSIIL